MKDFEGIFEGIMEVIRLFSLKKNKGFVAG